MFNRSKKKETATSVSAETNCTVVATPLVTVAEITGELIAVITAAIAAMEGNQSANANGFIVRRISRISGNSTTWANAGLMECIDSRKV